MKINAFEKHHDGSEGPQNLLLVNSDNECILFYGHGTDELGGFRWRKDYDHRPTMEELKADIEELINEKVSERILSGFSYEGKPVSLTREKQLDFRSTPSVPVRMKLGEEADGTPVYHTFETQRELTAFNKAVSDYINQCLNEGWDEKDAVDYNEFIN